MRIWTCKIGEVESVAGGTDLPMREAVAAAYRHIAGKPATFLFSGWDGELTEPERAVVENRLPSKEYEEQWHASTPPAPQPGAQLAKVRTMFDRPHLSDIEHPMQHAQPEGPQPGALEVLREAQGILQILHDKGPAVGFGSGAVLARIDAILSAPAPEGQWVEKAREWRNDAIEEASKIAARYECFGAASDIRAMLQAAPKPGSGT